MKHLNKLAKIIEMPATRMREAPSPFPGKWMFEDPIYPLLFKAVAEANTPELQKRIQAAREVWEKENRETSK